MESALEAIGNAWTRQDRKRRRVVTVVNPEANASSASASSDSTEPAAPEAKEADAVHPALNAPDVQKRLYTCVHGLIDEVDDRTSGDGAAFLARSTYAMFMAVQAVHPIPYGLQWVGLLYICYCVVSQKFFDKQNALPRQEECRVREMRSLTRHMGMGPSQSADGILMKDARRWERNADNELTEAMMAVWYVVHDHSHTRLRMAVESLLWPCQRAYLLFDNAHS